MPPVHRFAAFVLPLAVGLAGCAAPRACPPTPCAAAPANPWRTAAARHGSGSAAVWSYLRDAYDRDGDGVVRAAEAGRDEAAFARADRDGDGAWTAADFAGPTRMAALITALALERLAASVVPPAAPPDAAATADRARREPLSAEALAATFAAADEDRSSTLTARELDAALARAHARPVAGVLDVPAGVRAFDFVRETADRDASGSLTLAELEAWRAEHVAAERSAAERAAAARAAAGAGAGAGAARPGAPPSPPDVGDVAPDFTLRSRGGTRTRSLSDLRGTPVVLVFGSYTCPPFRASAPWIRAAYDRHRDAARFLFVYVREAHAVDGRAPMPSADQPLVEEPRSFEDRRAVADACALELRFGVFETLVDDLDDAVARAYAAPPVRLYVVGRDGRVLYRSGPGPFGLRREEFDAAVDAAVLAPR